MWRKYGIDPPTDFERYVLSQEVPSLKLPQLPGTASVVDIFERGWILGYTAHIPRGEENLRKLAIVVGIVPASEAEVSELELAGY
jgi:hypothetical protein